MKSFRKMANIILLCTVFSTTSIEAAWFYDSSASNPKVPVPQSPPPPPPRCPHQSSGPPSPCPNQPPGPPPPPPCPNQPPGPPPPPPYPNQSSGPPPPPPYYYQSTGPPPPPPSSWSYQFGPPPPPPPMEYYSSSQTYVASAPLPPMPPMPPMNAPAPMPPPKRLPGQSQDQAQTLSVAAHQSYSIDEQQSSIAMDSTEDISTDDNSTTAEEKLTPHHLKTPSLFEEKDSSKPDLSCILFDDSVCSITCNEVCLLYNFESAGVCTETKSCHCTITSLRSPKMNFDQYETQSLEDLWDQKFSKSTISAKVLNQIKKYPKITSKVLEMLRKPLRTGDDIKNRLVTAYPDWSILNDLKSRKKSPINRFIDDDYKLDESGLEKRIKRSIKRYQEDILGEFSSKDYLQNLTQFMGTIEDEKQLVKILKQIHETKIKSLIKHVNNYLHNRGLDLSVEDAESKECDCVDADYIDNIVAGVIIKQFVTTISASSKSSKTSNKKSSKIATSSVKYTAESSTKTSYQNEQNSSTTTYANVDQCSCPSEKSTTKYLDDDSRWVLPGFDAYIISDCSGAINEEWSTSGYYVHYTRGASGAYEVVWRKGNDNVNIRVGASGAVTQDWRLNGASISLSVGASGAINQSWDLGDVSYTYTKGASGSTTRRWRNNNRDQSTLSRYQGYISSWCSKNYFLVRSGDCVIY